MRGKQAADTPPPQTRPVRSGLALTLLAVITALSMLALFNLVTRSPNQPNTNPVVTVTGTPVCLPHKSDGLLTMECAIGLKGDDSRYYGLENASSNLAQEDFGKRVRVKGKLSAPHPDTLYDIAGTINVDSATRQ